jgi:MFS-type transporter involved in bile tolerance (Atg22 family)
MLIAATLRNIRRTFLEIVRNKAVFVFMLAYFFYIDGVNTVIHMATVYGSSLGLGATGMILALLVTQVVAVPFSILFSRLSARFGSIRMISIAIAVYFVICSVGFYMGFSLEPSQNAYQERYDQVTAEALAQTDLRAMGENDRAIFQNQLAELLTAGRGILPNSNRAEDFQALVDEASASAANRFSNADALAAARSAFATLGQQTGEFLADPVPVADFAKALHRAALLFWAMAALVGTCQGGIQALSRSFFGKLVPPNRSNEYFGFFDIFGKFAAVLGPALYSLTADLTGRSSFGILSLILLFAIGFAIILTGRKHLRQAEEQALGAANGSQRQREG